MSIPSSNDQKSILFAFIETKLFSKYSLKKHLYASKKAQFVLISQTDVYTIIQWGSIVLWYNKQKPPVWKALNLTLSDITVDFASRLLKYAASILREILICLTFDPAVAYLGQGLYLPGMNTIACSNQLAYVLANEDSSLT